MAHKDELQGNWRIAPTAYFTAQAWVQEGYDCAGYFDTMEGRLLFNSAKLLMPFAGLLGPGVRHHLDYLRIRHAVYEERLRQLDPEIVVEIGAGLSPRGLSFSRKNPGMTYVEGDLSHMVAAKRRALRKVNPPPNYHIGTLDLLGSGFVSGIPVPIVSGSRVVAVTEGVTDYLNMAEKRQAWSNIAGMLRQSGEGHYLFEVYARELFTAYAGTARVVTALLGTFVGADFDGRLFDTIEDARAMVKSCGFASVDVLELEALNRTSHHPPMENCPFRLLEARTSP